MKILAIDSSSLTASVAIVEDELTIAEYTVNYKKTHSQTLLPMLDEIVKMTEQELGTIDAIAVAAGPGSFTGLRIGSATVKGLAQALNKPVVSVPTVDGLAGNLYGTDKLVCPVMDARRNQTYTGLYEFVKKEESYEMHCVEEQCAVDIKEMIDKINALGREVIFLGDGVPVFADIIREHIKMPYSFAPSTCNRQRAAVIGWIGMKLFSQGIYESAVAHAPEYLRLSQAERELKEKNSKQ
jgi:tRNA threonylcarbamoyladenosine biosynthesis protein TsaB